ncbi:MAG: 50S ribosomal protein L9 [Thermaerobacter sp.]|nr:50S ribosomal protein L9 [Thermaerobacter sp.]
MEIILVQDVENLGKKGEVKTVKDGYGRNYLIPRGFAERATPGKLKVVRERQAADRTRQEKRVAEAQTRAESLKGLRVDIEVNAGESGRLFGSVTSQDVADALAKRGITIDKKDVRLEGGAMKALGDHEATVHLYEGVNVPILVRLIPS